VDLAHALAEGCERDQCPGNPPYGGCHELYFLAYNHLLGSGWRQQWHAVVKN